MKIEKESGTHTKKAGRNIQHLALSMKNREREGDTQKERWSNNTTFSIIKEK